MDKIREALEAVVETTEWAPKNGRYMDAWRMCVEAAKAALSAPVASDARELVYTIWQTVTQGSGTYWTAREDEAAALIERFASERERKAREEEREACAERAVAWVERNALPGMTIGEAVNLQAAIKEAGNGN